MPRCLSTKRVMGTFHLLVDEQGSSISISLEVLMAALKASSSIQDLDAGKRIHSDAAAAAAISNVFVANTLINLYAKCGCLADAVSVFDAMRDHTIVSWNALVLAFALNSREELALEAIAKIRQQGLEPNARTFVAGFKACAGLVSFGSRRRGAAQGDEQSLALKNKFVYKGMELHCQALADEFLSDVYVGNGLIDMYSKWGSLIDARRVFDTMPILDVASWTTLIAGYAENGEEQVALELFSAMEPSGCSPNARTYVAALAACSSLAERERKVDGKKSVEQTGMAIHSRTVDDGCDSDLFVASSLVNFYVKCGSPARARQIFDRMIHKDVVTWTCLILGYAENGQGELALDLFRKMPDQQCDPNARTYVAALVACSSLADKETGQLLDGMLVKVECLRTGMALHREAVKRGYESEIFVANSLVDMYSKCGSLIDARRVVDRMDLHDAVSWSTLILGYADNGEAETGIELFEEMACRGCVPTARTFVSVLVAASNLAASKRSARSRCLELAAMIHDRARRSKCDADTFLANALIELYVKCGSLSSARAVFDWLPSRDTVSWNTMILGYADDCQDELALELFSEMIRLGQCEPSARTFVAALQACAGLSAREASQPDGSKVCCLEKVMEIHSQAMSGKSWDVFVESAVINAYGKCGSLVDARWAFDKMEVHDVVSWTALLLGCVETGDNELGLELFARMTSSSSRVAPNARTFAAAIMASGNLARLETGKNIHAETCRRGTETDLLVASCLVDLYGNCGSAGNAELVVETIESRDPVLWTSLVSAFSDQGNTARVVQVFETMRREGIAVNGVTFLSLLSACSRAGMIDTGKRWFQEMDRKFGVVAGIEHYHCVVDMLGRGNRLDEALEIVERMPFDPTVVTWTTLLAACGKWNNVVIGRIAYAALVKLDATQAATYTLMAKLEAS